MDPGSPDTVAVSQSGLAKPTGVGDQLVNQLSDALTTQVSLPNLGGSAASTSLSGPSNLPSQFVTAGLVGVGSSPSSSPTPTLLQNSGFTPQTGGFTSPLLVSSAGPSPLAAPLSMTPTPLSVAPSPLSVAPSPLSVAPTPLSSTLTPLPQFISQTPTTKSAGPPPKTGFQPAPHGLQDPHHTPHTPHAPAHSMQSTVPAPVGGMTAPQAGVNIFTPSYDPSAPPSPYNTALSMQNTQSPPHQGSMHSSYGVATLDMSTVQDSNADSSYNRQNSQDLNTLIEWIKTNETVYKMMQKAKTGVQTVITAMDPQMRDVLYSGGDINIMVASSKAVKVEPVKEAFQSTFGRATVNGKDSQPTIAPQPVGFDAGVKGAEERIGNMRRTGIVNEQQVCVAVENFIVELQPEMWYDIACLLLSDPVHGISIQAFSQATPIPVEYVRQAQSECPPNYSLASTGYSVTIGQVIQRHLGADPGNWHSLFGGISRVELLHSAAKQLAFLYQKQLANK